MKISVIAVSFFIFVLPVVLGSDWRSAAVCRECRRSDGPLPEKHLQPYRHGNSWYGYPARVAGKGFETGSQPCFDGQPSNRLQWHSSDLSAWIPGDPRPTRAE